jgi:hypothetical protein
MLVRQKVVSIARLEVGDWHRDLGEPGAEVSTESRKLVATLSDGESLVTWATVKYQRGERERFAEQVVEESLSRAERGTAEQQLRAFLDRRARAFLETLGDLQRRFGALPKSVRLVEEPA